MAETHLIGTYEHTIDAKGRMAFPTKLRERLGLSFIVTIGSGGCLFVYSGEEWDIFVGNIKTLTGDKAKAAKLFITNAYEAEPDKQGRIMIPQILRDRAGLEHGVTIVGVGNRAEIWSSERYSQFTESITDEMLDDALADLAF